MQDSRLAHRRSDSPSRSHGSPFASGDATLSARITMVGEEVSFEPSHHLQPTVVPTSTHRRRWPSAESVSRFPAATPISSREDLPLLEERRQSTDLHGNSSSPNSGPHRDSHQRESSASWTTQSNPEIRPHEFRLEPVEPPPDYLPLDFRPTMLTGKVLFLSLLLYLGVGTVLGILFYLARTRPPWQVRNVNYYLTARYLPPILGTITNLLFKNMLDTLRRMMPFIFMADQGRREKKGQHSINRTLSARYFPWIEARAPFTWFLLFDMCSLSFFIAFKSVLLSVQSNSDGTWSVSVRTAPAAYLLSGYVLMFSSTAYIWYSYARLNTGLKRDWDPTSLADIIALTVPLGFIPSSKYPLEYRKWKSMMQKDNQSYRLGYWRMSGLRDMQPYVIYGIGPLSPAAPPRQDYLEQLYCSIAGKDVFELRLDQPSSTGGFAHASQCFHNVGSASPPSSNHNCSCKPKCEHYPYRRPPFVSWLLAFQTILLVLFIVALGYALLRAWIYQDIFSSDSWLITTADSPASNQTYSQNSTQTSPVVDGPLSLILQHKSSDALASFLFRGLPIWLVGFIAGNAIPGLDIHHRWSQPYVNMYGEPGDASKTLLLDYMTVSPVEVMPQAWNNGDHKVLWYSILNALNWIPPLLMGGVCEITHASVNSVIVVQFSPTPATASLVWSLVYLISILVAWPCTSPKRKLPRNVGTLYDQFCFFYGSRLRWKREFIDAALGQDFTKEDLHAQIFLRKDKYLFGMIGETGKEHTGFDVAIAKDISTGHVHWVEPVPRWGSRLVSVFKSKKARINPSGSPDVENLAMGMRHVDNLYPVRRRAHVLEEETSDGAHSSALD